MVKVIAKTALAMTAAAGIALFALAAEAQEQAPETQIDLDGETITIACAVDKLNDVWVQYARCQEIFDDSSERELAETYCKPLAVAQACSDKNVPSI